MDRDPHIFCILFVFIGKRKEYKKKCKKEWGKLSIPFAICFVFVCWERDTKRDAKRDAYFSHTFLLFPVQAVGKGTEGIKRIWERPTIDA